jgi:hypothetical protein
MPGAWHGVSLSYRREGGENGENYRKYTNPAIEEFGMLRAGHPTAPLPRHTSPYAYALSLSSLLPPRPDNRTRRQFWKKGPPTRHHCATVTWMRVSLHLPLFRVHSCLPPSLLPFPFSFTFPSKRKHIPSIDVLLVRVLSCRCASAYGFVNVAVTA